MANVIVFHVPGNFQKKVKWVPPSQRGKLIPFPCEVVKSA